MDLRKDNARVGTRAVLLLSLLAGLPLAACGGGGGGPAPVSGEVRLQVSDLELLAGADRGEIQVSLPQFSADRAPVLLEFTVRIEPPRVTIAPVVQPLSAAQAAPTVDGDTTDDGYRVLFGYGADGQARPLVAGPLLRLALQTASPRAPGTATLTLSRVRAVDAAGDEVPVEPTPVVGQVVVR